MKYWIWSDVTRLHQIGLSASVKNIDYDILVRLYQRDTALRSFSSYFTDRRQSINIIYFNVSIIMWCAYRVFISNSLFDCAVMRTPFHSATLRHVPRQQRMRTLTMLALLGWSVKDDKCNLFSTLWLNSIETVTDYTTGGMLHVSLRYYSYRLTIISHVGRISLWEGCVTSYYII